MSDKKQDELKKRQGTIISQLVSLKDQIQAALPKHVSADRMVRIAMTVVRTNPQLAMCSDASFFGALITASQLGLEPNTPLGQCYLIPYGTECTFQMGYQGILDLGYRSKMYRKIFAEHVYPGDKFSVVSGLKPDLIHERLFPEAGEPDKFYGVYETIDGGTHFVVWGKDRVIAHARKYSQSFNNSKGAWKKSFDGMAKKTVLINLMKYAPKSIEIAQAVAADNSVPKLDLEALKEGCVIDITNSYKDDEDDGATEAEAEAPKDFAGSDLL